MHKDKDLWVRSEAARCLAEREDAWVIPVLVELVGEKENQFRPYHAAALAQFPDDGRAQAALDKALLGADQLTRELVKQASERAKSRREKNAPGERGK